MKRPLKISLLIVGVGILLLAFAILRFLTRTEAPMLKGDVSYGIPYKEGKALDIYQPTKDVYEKRPVLIYVHGGAWVIGSKMAVNNSRFNGAFNQLRDRGYVILSPEYTLAREGQPPFPDSFVDLYDFLQWVEANAKAYNLDLNNVTLMGESAGAHIAMMCTTEGLKSHKKRHAFDYNGFIDVYGPSHLYTLYEEKKPQIDQVMSSLESLPECAQEHLDISKLLFGFDPELDLNYTKRYADGYSPVLHMNKSFPPTLIIQGDKDRIVPQEQSIRVKNTLDSQGVPNAYYNLSGVDHGFRGASKDQKANIQKWITDFVLKKYR